jgi:ferric-dicitrate binding protein FerR (iron transport regulator)
MSRRSVPRIAPADLRDHAEEARIDRVWARIEPELVVAPAASRRPVLAYLAIAAAFSAFAGGVFVGKVAFQGPVLTAIAPVQSNERTRVDVLAAGSEGRSFPLPGGGQLQLQPGATVEVERAGGQLTLKLLQGAASVDTLSAPQTPGLMIVAGEAQLNTQAGSVVNVRRNQDDLDVSVSDGSVSITSPADPKPRKLGRGGQLERVPLHTAVAALSPTSPPMVRGPLLAAGAHRPNQPRAGGKSAAVDAPGWLTSYENNEDTTALALLRQLPGGLPGAISNARSAQELMAISTIARGKDGDPGAG